MTLDDVLESLVEECHEDHVGLWRIVNAVRFDLASSNPAETRVDPSPRPQLVVRAGDPGWAPGPGWKTFCRMGSCAGACYSSD